MNTYEGFYLEGDIRHSRVYITAANDAEALVRAEELLADSRFNVIEIRQDDRMIGRVALATPAEFMAGEGSGHTPPPR